MGDGRVPGEFQNFSENFFFQNFERAAWKDIIALEKLHTRIKRQVEKIEKNFF